MFFTNYSYPRAAMDGNFQLFLFGASKLGALLLGLVGAWGGNVLGVGAEDRRLATAGFDMDEVVAGNYPRDRTPLASASAGAGDEDSVRLPQAGMVFLENSYLPAPYVVTADHGQLSINGVPVKFGHIDPDPKRQAEKAPRSADHLTRLLNAPSIVAITSAGELDVLSAGHLQAEFLRRLLGLPWDEASDSAGNAPGLPQKWLERTKTIHVTGTIQQIANRLLDRLHRIHEDNLQSSIAVQRFHNAAYPLTVFGMLICVFSMGHLLQSAPRIQTEAQRRETSDQWIRAATISVALFVVMAMLDLAWTLLASNAGKMQELNPMGSSLLGEPVRLILAKVGATIMSAGILIALRTNPRAQKAAWWVCLLCTLLTMRWLVLNSLFVG